MFDLLAATSVALGPLDGLIVVAYLVATTLFGVWLGRGQADNRDYFLGGHRLPTWALLLSIVATETSTVTFLSIPGLAYAEAGDFTFLQLPLGYILGRLAIVVWLLPGYFRGEMMTAYQLLERRFGLTTRRLASLVFLITRNLADGLRLFLTALALNIALGLDMLICILVITVATAIYSCAGGVRSVVWNDCIQFGVYMLGGLAAAYLLLSQVPGGWNELATFGEATARFRFFDFDPSLTKPTVTFWSGVIGGAFLSLATHGADQLIVQRYLCARNQASAGWALGLSGFVVFAQFALFLFIGVQLAWFFSVHEPPVPITKPDQALMTYIVYYMGIGLKGVILAAVLSAAMSTLSSSFNSSASSLLNDWLGRFLSGLDDRRSLLLARLVTVAFAGVQATVAVVAYRMEVQQATVNLVLAVAGFSIGLLLGLYGLGLLVPKTSETTALLAFSVGAAVTCGIAFGTNVHWPWYTLVGSGTIVLVGLALGAILDRGRMHISES